MIGVGDRLGSNYVMGKVIGRGSMGVVHEARSLSTGRPVAIKILHPHLASDTATVGRFVQERQAFERIRHSNVVRVLDLVIDVGHLGIVMEHVKGTDLRRLMARRSLNAVEVVDIGRQLASGLEEIHATRIIHCDLKPGNVLVTGRERLKVKITDFGISELTAAHKRTSNTVVGTPLYMAPEVAKMGATIGPPFDIYALGVTLFEMLVGQPPFDGASPVAILQAHLRQPPPGVGGVPPALSDLVAAMLAKDPEERPRAHEAVGRLTTIAPLVGPDDEPYRVEPTARHAAALKRNPAFTRFSAFASLVRQAERRQAEELAEDRAPDPLD